MSVTSVQNAINTTRTLKRWHVVLGWVLVIAVIFVGFTMFSGKIVLWGSSAPTQSIPNIQPPSAPTPVIRPAEAQTMLPPAKGGPADKQGSDRYFDADRAKALASDNMGFPNSQSQNIPTAQKDKEKDAEPSDGELNPVEASLKRGHYAAASIVELPSPLYMIQRGRILPCIQDTKLNSTLPGMITAHISEPIRGDAGNLILIPAGSTVVGTLQHALVNGLDRVAVLWEDLTTPVMYDSLGISHHFRIPIDSPATSDLGETGMDGDVNRHLLKKIGGIVGMSLIQGAIQAGIQSASNNKGTQLNFNSFQSGGDNAADVLLRSWVAIPDIMTRDPGLTCGVGIIRDLLMKRAYEVLQRYRTAGR